MRNFFIKFDSFFIELINNRIKNRFFDKFMYRITDLGGAIFSTIFSVVLVLLGNDRIRLVGIEALVILGLSQLIVQVFKRGLGRERPYKIIEDLHTFGIELPDYSFPSGHTTASFSIASALALNIPSIGFLAYIFAITIGISRIYLGVHYPTDVVAGIILGSGSSIVVHFYMMSFIENIASYIA